MDEWKEYKLGELITLNSGGTPDKNNKSYWDGEIPWISAKFMYDDYLYSSELKISQDGLTSGSRLAPKGSILLLTRGSGLFNRIPVCYTMRDLAYNQDVKCIESKNKELVSTEYYDELFIERSSKGNYWIHFAVRPKDNRRKTAFIQT